MYYNRYSKVTFEQKYIILQINKYRGCCVLTNKKYYKKHQIFNLEGTTFGTKKTLYLTCGLNKKKDSMIDIRVGLDEDFKLILKDVNKISKNDAINLGYELNNLNHKKFTIEDYMEIAKEKIEEYQKGKLNFFDNGYEYVNFIKFLMKNNYYIPYYTFDRYKDLNLHLQGKIIYEHDLPKKYMSEYKKVGISTKLFFKRSEKNVNF